MPVLAGDDPIRKEQRTELPRHSETLSGLFVDVRRAYFYAPAKRPVHVALPEKDAEPGMCVVD